MSKIKADHVFTSESVSEGHPDKICDQISDAILDDCIILDPMSRVACETVIADGLVVNVGEVTCNGWDHIDTQNIARRKIREIGYDRESLRFWPDSFVYVSRIHEQSPEIARGVAASDEEGNDGNAQGAGDQGMMFGYATNDTEELMPAPIAYSHRLMKRLADLRRQSAIPYLRPDGKAQVSVRYVGGKPNYVTTVVVSQQTDDVDIKEVRRDIEEVVRQLLGPTGLIGPDTRYLVNPTGSFTLGGPCADSGLTGRKIVVDTYGGVASHGGGAFSGKDPSKVDRSAAYYARYVAKNIVAAGLAEKCEIQVAYAIGIAEPVSINIYSFGTGIIEDERLHELIANTEIFDFRPAKIIQNLGLLKPEGWSYQQTAAYGHFGRSMFPWERTEKADLLKDAVAIK